ncbi:603_t:CDS:2, partial [Acaulospora morrowiae]
MSISHISSQTHAHIPRSLSKESKGITMNNASSESIKSNRNIPSSPSIRSVHQFAHIHQKRLSRTIQHISSFLQVTANISPKLSFPVTVEKTYTVERLARQIEAEYAFKFGGIEMVGQYEPLEVGLLYDVSMVALRFRDIIGDVLEHGDIVHVLNIYEDCYPKEVDESSEIINFYDFDKDLPPIPSSDGVLLPTEKRFSLQITSYQDNLEQPKGIDLITHLGQTPSSTSVEKWDQRASRSSLASITQIQNFVQASESRFQTVLSNTLSLHYFQKFAIRDFCVENLLFWLDVELFAAGVSCDIEDNYFEQQQTAVIHARYIYLTYISANAPLQVNLSDEIRRETTWPIDDDAEVKRDMFDEAQEAVYQLMKGHTFIRFEESPEWKEFLKIKENDPEAYKRHEMTEPLEKYFRPNMSLMLAVTMNLDNGSDQTPISYHYKEQTLHSMLSQYFPETVLDNKGKKITSKYKEKASESLSLSGYFNSENRMTNAQRMRRLKKERKLQWIFGAKVGRVEDQIVVLPKESLYGDLLEEDSKSTYSTLSANRKATKDAWNRKRKVDKLEAIFGKELRDSQTAQNLFRNKTVIPPSPQKVPSDAYNNLHLQTVNELSKAEKRKLRKSTKKLQVMLGETLDEDTVRQALSPVQQNQTPISASNGNGQYVTSERLIKNNGNNSLTNRRASTDSTIPPP